MDRENVIKGFEICDNNEDGIVCNNCPYKEDKWNGAWEDETGKTCFQTLHADVLALLKEQEAVEPKHNPLSPTDWFCGKCGMCISRFHDYCPSCGNAVKWE